MEQNPDDPGKKLRPVRKFTKRITTLFFQNCIMQQSVLELFKLKAHKTTQTITLPALYLKAELI